MILTHQEPSTQSKAKQSNSSTPVAIPRALGRNRLPDVGSTATPVPVIRYTPMQHQTAIQPKYVPKFLRQLVNELSELSGNGAKNFLNGFEATWEKVVRGYVADSGTGVPLDGFKRELLQDFFRMPIGESKADIKTRISLWAHRYGMGDAVEKPDQLLLGQLGERLHLWGKQGGLGDRNELIDQTAETFPPDFRDGVDEQKEYVKSAMSRIPASLLGEEDKDHEGGLPDIGELLALEAYTRIYENPYPEKQPNDILMNYHRGGGGLPDFLYRIGGGELRGYDPMQLPDISTVDTEKGVFSSDAYLHHASGKNSGAVCILDASRASEEQLRKWIDAFAKEFETIAKDLEHKEDKLVYLCNTFAVSYGRNRESAEMKALQQFFDDAREFLRKTLGEDYLEQWRTREMEPPLFRGRGRYVEWHVWRYLISVLL